MGQITVDLSSREELKKSLPVAQRTGIQFPRYFTAKLEAGKTPYDEVAWETRTATIGNDKGSVIFEQRDIEVPVDWSQTATNIVASKYFHGKLGSPERERSVAELVHRVVDTIADWGIEGRLLQTPEDAENFRHELAHLMLHQKACFNSPVWFNVGVKESRGYGWYYDEATEAIKKLESGATPAVLCLLHRLGERFARIHSRSRQDRRHALQVGLGHRHQPLAAARRKRHSLRRRTRLRSAVLHEGLRRIRRRHQIRRQNAPRGEDGHPQRRPPRYRSFIWCKAKEEKKAHTLIEAGYDSSLDGEAYSSIFFQNANNSVRATDEFMQAVVDDNEWWTKSRRQWPAGEDRYNARELMREIAEATWQCGDPGMQFDTTINRWHPCKNTSRINASNPCSEYMFLDDSACNLSSLNLMKFVGPDGQFDVEAFRHAVDTLIVAQEILVDNASYPTEKIAQNSHDYRPLGLGFANLGALLMSFGIPYDSDQGRDYAGAITAVMCGQAYLTSARIADSHRPVPRLREERAAVPRRHPHAPRCGEPHQSAATSRATMFQGARTVLGRRSEEPAAQRITATARLPSSRPPAPSAS